MVNNENPLISIVIPAYNVASTVSETLDSVVAQTYDNIETIIVDDGSTDNTLQIVEQYIADKPSMHVYTKDNEGSPRARNHGLAYARGKYVVFLDADDRLKNTYIMLAVTHHLKYPDTTIVYSNLEFFERETGLFPLMPFEIKAFLHENCIPVFAMVKTEQIKAIGGFDETVGICQDWECWIHLLKMYPGDVYRIEEPQYYYRKRFARDSISDGYDQSSGKLKDVKVYVFFKHQSLYEAHGMALGDFYRMEAELESLTKKYYNIWYRKYFYKWFKPKKYHAIYTRE